MKALYCVACGDIRALDPSCGPVSCRCGRSHGRWVNPYFGIAVFCETSPEGGEADSPGSCRFLGMHNEVLGDKPNYQAWENADGYLFKVKQSVIVNCRPGNSTDTRMTDHREVFSGANR